MGTLHELAHVLAAVPDALSGSDDLPRAERMRRLRGVPMHIADVAALGSLRVVPCEDGGEGRRVLVLHGYGGHPRSTGLLRRHLQERGFHTESVDLRGYDRVQGMGDQLVEWIVENVDPNAPIPIVAHSLGGVIARFALREPEVRRRVAKLITLGSPHEGTHIAALVDARKASQMERDAELTETLESQEPWPADELPKLICLWSRADLMMVPPEAACADGAEHRELAGITHYGFMLRSTVFEAVADALED